MINRENNAICIVLGAVYSDNYAEIGTGKSGFEIVFSFRSIRCGKQHYRMAQRKWSEDRFTLAWMLIVYDWRQKWMARESAHCGYQS